MLSILVSEIKEGKNAQNIKKLLTLEKHNLSPKLNNPPKIKKKKKDQKMTVFNRLIFIIHM
jgi:hypothetical protein